MLLFAGFGRVIAGTGSADEYVRQLLRAIELCEDPSIRAMLQVFLCQAYGYAGKLREALAAGETALKQVASIERAHERSSGSTWNGGLRACTRGCWSGRQLRCCAGAHRQTGRHRGRPSRSGGPVHSASCRSRNGLAAADEKLADLHSLRIDEIARRNNTPYVAVYASVCRGLALSLAGDHVEAIRKLEIRDPARARGFRRPRIRKRHAGIPCRDPSEE